MNKQSICFFVSAIFCFLILSYSGEKNGGSIQSKNDKFFPSEIELLKRTFPYFDYDKNAYKDALIELKKLKVRKLLQKNSKNKINAELDFVGPTNIGGRIVDIEFNPKSPNIVYAAAATGGVFKSVDTGINWVPIFDDQPSLTIGDIGIDPNSPEIIYVGTGEANGGHNNFPGFGLYKSSDGGKSWNFIGLDSTASIGRIIVDPSNSQRIFVAALGSYFTPNPQRGIYLSEDGGNSWEKSLFVSDSTGAVDLVIDPINTNVIYAAMWERVRRPVFKSGTHLFGPSGGIFKSVDGGKNWDKLGPLNGLPNPQLEQIGRIGLTISKSNPSILYALYNDGNYPTGLYKTTDSGDNWSKITSAFRGASNFSWYFGQVRVDPDNSENVYVLDVSFLKSSDSGLNWDFSYGYIGPEQLHVDHHALAFHPTNSNYLISGNDGGINISEDGGNSWSEPVSLPITQFYEIGLDFTNEEKFYGGTQDNNTITTKTGNENDWERIFGGDGFYVIVNPDNPNIIYAESQFGGLGKSDNGGASFSPATSGIDQSEPTNWSTPVVMDPNNSDILYYGTHTLYRTENGAEAWTKVSPKLTDHNEDRRLGTITTIAVAPTNSNVIYVGTDDGNVWVSSDFGNNWNNISDNLPYRWVTRVVVDPHDENVVYTTFSGLKWADSQPRVFRSDDMGNNWENISSNLPDAPVNAFAIDNNNTDVLYLGNDIGAFISHNKGESWEVLSNSLPIVVVNDMKIHPTQNYLAIGTHGRGMYKINLNELVEAKNLDETHYDEFTLSQNYPNPFNPNTIIKYSVPSVNAELSNNVKIVVYDILGKKIATLVDKNQQPGKYNISFNGSKYSSGVYYYKLSYGDYSKTRKMILLK